MVTQQQKAEQFLELHHKGPPLLMPNPWDAGSARLFASLGFAALATTGGALAYAAFGAAVAAARELQEHGTYGYWDQAKAGVAAVRAAFKP